MIQDAIQGIQSFVSKIFGKESERILVIEEKKGGFVLTVLRFNPRSKKLTVKKKFARKRPLSWKPIWAFDKAVLALSSKNSTTIEASVSLRRGKSDRAIDDEEVSSLVFSGLREFLSRYRLWAAKKMDVSESDLVLAYISAKGVTLEGRKVLNPVGFKGRRISFRFQGTFVPREVSELTKRFGGWANQIIVIERASVLLSDASLPVKSVAICAGRDEATVFTLSEDESGYHAEIQWGERNFLERVALEFSVSTEVAKELIRMREAELLSKKTAGLIERIFAAQLDLLYEKLKDSFGTKKKRVKLPPIWIFFCFKAPIPVPGAVYGNFYHASFIEEASRRGFRIEVGSGIDFAAETHQNTLALAGNQYFYPHYDFLNKVIERRARWLMP